MFKESFKYYKSKKPKPNLEEVLDIHIKSDELIKLSQIKRVSLNDDNVQIFGLKPSRTWEVFEIVDRPGLIYIKNPFTALGQRYWTIRCLRDFPNKLNKRNIDTLNILPENEDWWEAAQNDRNILNKLRWATLGYHHNWDTKVYSEDDRSSFPKDLKMLTRAIADSLGYSNFNAEAAIVNYYHMDSTLSGHTDHSEQNLDAPLFSFSFGQTAVFLLGGKTLEEKPVAIYLKSGDIVVMSKESRLAYHGVPKILKAEKPSWDFICPDDDSFNKDFNENEISISREEHLWKFFGDFLCHSRININVRQVLKRGQKRLNDTCIL